ncbi:hypothetical protein LARV_02396 [Longilinea arvoryzae]|uniref:Dolichyl-phosphate-mannose-protein mannosyltransferase n=1 Tax=Longilinea arvoryzae TaxID=360412 RepID=A0A0S7BAG5_9CHLR|nr:hypothetical protein [Longilinea arvoryzae]GAP14623.1 hypothetical protein LARV_02396 [Longilinea arvoryzae]
MNVKKLWPILILLGITVIYLLGTSAVPFHPDEATQIYMSADWETLFHHPGDLFYSLTPADPVRQNYRLLDAPLTRWLIGAGRSLAGVAALPVDWDWSKPWQQNEQAGALPGNTLLLVSRLSVAWLFGISLWFIYRAGCILKGPWMGWTGVALAALNALVLMHTRRAMAESALFCAVCWVIYVLAKKETHPILLALPAALAVNAKQTAAGLVLVVLLAAWIYPQGLAWPKRLRNTCLCAIFILLATYLLNPVAWKAPLSAARAAVEVRSELATRQIETLAAVSPERVMRTPVQRATGWLGYLFFTPPATADVANYVTDTQTAEANYFSNPLNNLLRSVAGGMVLLAISLAGFLLAGFRTLRNIREQPSLGLLLAATLIPFFSLILFIPLPFQRYGIILVPFVNLWMAAILTELIRIFIKNREA